TRPRFLCLTNLREYTDQGKHYADVGMVAHWVSGDLRLMESEKCTGWTWHPIDRLPTPLFAPVENLVIAYHTGQPYFARSYRCSRKAPPFPRGRLRVFGETSA